MIIAHGVICDDETIVEGSFAFMSSEGQDVGRRRARGAVAIRQGWVVALVVCSRSSYKRHEQSIAVQAINSFGCKLATGERLLANVL